MYNHKYYEEHKEELKRKNAEWRKKNKKRFYELVKKSRTKKANELRQKGEIYVWHSEPSRKKLYERRNQRFNKVIEDGEIQDNND